MKKQHQTLPIEDCCLYPFGELSIRPSLADGILDTPAEYAIEPATRTLANLNNFSGGLGDLLYRLGAFFKCFVLIAH